MLPASSGFGSILYMLWGLFCAKLCSSQLGLVFFCEYFPAFGIFHLLYSFWRLGFAQLGQTQLFSCRNRYYSILHSTTGVFWITGWTPFS